LSLVVSGAQVVGGVPSKIGLLTQAENGLLSPPIAFALGTVCLLNFLSIRHFLFRRMYHAGSDRQAVKNVGINVLLLDWIAFTCAGLGAAIVGILQCSRTLSASPFAFPDLALECIAACVIGGCRVSGGVGSAWGAFGGMFIVVTSRNLVAFASISLYWRDLGIAAVLLAAVLLNSRNSTVKKKC